MIDDLRLTIDDLPIRIAQFSEAIVLADYWPATHSAIYRPVTIFPSPCRVIMIDDLRSTIDDLPIRIAAFQV
jgi:hypothetical protein